MTEKSPSSFSESKTDASLLRRVRERDERAWQDFVQLYAPLIGRWCHRYGLSESGIADVTQEVFLVVMRVLPRYEADRGSFRSWLWSITRNKILDRRKSPAKRSMGIGGSSFMRLLSEVEQAEGDLPLDEPPDAIGERALLMRALDQVRGEFHASTWAAFWRTVIDGLTHDAVAAEIGISNAAVRQAKSRVLRRLREQLGT